MQGTPRSSTICRSNGQSSAETYRMKGTWWSFLEDPLSSHRTTINSWKIPKTQNRAFRTLLARVKVSSKISIRPRKTKEVRATRQNSESPSLSRKTTLQSMHYSVRTRASRNSKVGFLSFIKIKTMVTMDMRVQDKTNAIILLKVKLPIKSKRCSELLKENYKCQTSQESLKTR